MKDKKTWLLLSLLCILSGILLSSVGILLGGIPGFYLDKSGIHTSRENASRSMEVFQDTRELEAFDCMDLNISNTDIMLVPSDRYAVDYRITGADKEPSCQVEDGRLTFQEGTVGAESRIWFLYSGPDIAFTREPGPCYVKIEFPADRIFSDITVRTESGDLTLPALQADTLSLSNEYGNVTLNGYDGQELIVHMTSGDLSFGSIRADQTKIQNEYGHVSMDEFDGKTLDIQMSSGDLSLGIVQTGQADLRNEYGAILISQASGNSLTADLNSGSFLADSLDFTSITIHNEYGLVRMGLPESSASCGYRLHTGYGTIRMDGQLVGDADEEDEVNYASEGSGERTVAVSCENGDIVIETVLSPVP